MSSVFDRLKDNEPLFGDYLLGEYIGSGSLSEVYEIYNQHKHDMKFAIKVVPITKETYESILGTTPNHRQSFHETVISYINGVHEQHLLKDCPNIVNIVGYTFKPHPDGLGEDIYIQMELLRNLNKEFSSSQEKDFDPSAVIKMGIDICAALETLYEKNIVHGNIKPENIFYKQSAHLYKLGDLTISNITNERTINASPLGTSIFSSPETVNHTGSDHRSDIYSLGLVMYIMMNDFIMPFQTSDTDNMDAIDVRNRGDRLPDPKNAYKCEELAQIVLKACEYKPIDRYQTAGQMSSDLENIKFKKPINLGLIFTCLSITLVLAIASAAVFISANLSSPSPASVTNIGAETGPLTESPPYIQELTETVDADELSHEFTISENGDINFTSDELENEIRSLCGINDRMLNTNDLKTIVSLDLSDYEAIEENFGIVEYFTALESLDVSNSKIKSIDSIIGLTGLTYLNLFNTDISDIELIPRLSSLEVLEIRNTNIQNISVLAKLENLAYLGIGRGIFSSGKPIFLDGTHAISQMNKLELLYIFGIDFDMSLLADMKNMKELKIERSEIANFDKISNLKDLEYLDLADVEIDDITCIGNLTNLQSLSMDSTGITDISSLSNLKNLKTLSLQGHEISDVSALNSNTKLEILKLSHLGDTIDISMLNNLENLVELEIYNSVISSISIIEKFHSLEKLTITATNYLEDEQNSIYALSNLKNLKELEIDLWHYSYVSEIVLQSDKLTSINISMENLTSLGLFNNNPQLSSVFIRKSLISSLAFLNHCPNLIELTLSSSTKDFINYSVINDLTGLEKLSITHYASGSRSLKQINIDFIDKLDKLTELRLYTSNVQDYSQIQYLKNLKTLNLSGCSVDNVIWLEHLDNIEDLNISWTDVKDISGLAHLINLKKLDISSTEVNDVSSLMRLVNLEELDISFTEVKDISSLMHLKSLKKLYISGTEVHDISRLMHLENLETLYMSSTDVKDISSINNLKNLRALSINETEISDVKPLYGLINLKYLFVSDSQILPDDLQALQEKLPGLEII